METPIAEHFVLGLRSSSALFYIAALVVWLRRPTPDTKCGRYLSRAFGSVIIAVTFFWTPEHVARLLRMQLQDSVFNTLVVGGLLLMILASYNIQAFWMCSHEEAHPEYVNTFRSKCMLAIAYVVIIVLCSSTVFVI